MNLQRKSRARARAQAGFSVIEALVAFVVVGFGMLGLAGMQLSLSRNADVAKQRTEAMRLAQDKMEALRSFSGIDTGGTVLWNNLASGADTVNNYSDANNTVVGATNANFTRTWTLGGTVNDVQRPVTVAVSWTDRAGDTQSVTLSSIMAKVNPKDADFLLFPLPENTNLKRPKNRNLNVPIQANTIPGTDNSYYKLGSISIVFSNLTGYVVQRCKVSNPTAADLLDKVNTCPVYNAYILAGYVSGAVAIDASHNPTMPTGINVSGISGSDPANPITCMFGQSTDQNNTDPANPTYIPNYDYYLCVIPMTTSTGTWSGTVRLGGVSTTGNYKVCRVQYAASDFVNSNERNVQAYSNVNESLDNQNYYIMNSLDGNCPTIGTAVSGVTGGTVGTVLHQDCRLLSLPSSGPTGTCPATPYNAPASAP